jgi:hypothetical protein
MGQVLQKDKIGELTESAGVITLASSVLTIGGQQFTVDSINLSLSSLNNDTRYYLYAVRDSAETILIESENNNDTGPAGYSAWKLVNIFRTDESGDFYSFGSIDSSGEILVESGKNANGDWTRWADGTQTCRTKLGGTNPVSWTFPVAFIGTADIVVVGNVFAADIPRIVSFSSVTTTGLLSWVFSETGSTSTSPENVLATGRWK